MCAQVTLHEDIFRAIVDQVVDSGHSLQALACASTLLADICRGHLFRRVRMDVFRPQDARALSAILARDPRLACAVRQVSITDVSPPTMPQPQTPTTSDGVGGSGPPEGYAQVTHEGSALAALLRTLRNLRAFELALTYVFATNDRAPLAWAELAPTVQRLVCARDVRTVRLAGVCAVPLHASVAFLAKDSVRLAQCTFAAPFEADTHAAPETTLRALSLAWPAYGPAPSKAECTSPLPHWLHARAPLPALRALSLAPSTWASLAEAAALLRLSSSTTTRIALDTTALRLPGLRLAPLFHAFASGALTHAPALDAAALVAYAAHGVPVLPPGWAARALLPHTLLAPESKPTEVRLALAYWPSLVHAHEDNGELTWACVWLSSLSPSTARTVEKLTLRVRLGEHTTCAREAARLLVHLADEEAWVVLRETLHEGKWGAEGGKEGRWAALREVRVEVVPRGAFEDAGLRALMDSVMAHVQGVLCMGIGEKVIVKVERGEEEEV